MKKKISRKLELKKETLRNYKGGIVVLWPGDFDFPTINDRCNPDTLICPSATSMALTQQNTYCICDPDDWCGFFHESN
jgi:hypothetical protein